MNSRQTQQSRIELVGTAALVLFAAVACGQALKWTQHEGYREAELAVPSTGRTGFTLLRPEQTGILFTNRLAYARAEANQNLMNGCGVAAGDFDGDGLCDLYFAHAEGANGLFRNNGQWRFVDATASAGVGVGNMSSKGVVFADVNGDGLLDLLVGALGGPNACFLNLGQGRFTNVTAAAGLVSKAGTHSLALADVDGDGDLDLYVANYGEVSILRSGGQISTRLVNGRPQITGRWAKRLKLVEGHLIELGEPDVLYLNDGKGVFTPVGWTGGAFLNENGQPLKAEPYDMGLSVMFRDINGDGAPDLYVCNDFATPDRIWLNDGRGHFRALPDLAVRTVAHFSMGVDFADIDRDGYDDFFVGDMLSRRHALRMTQMNATNPPASDVGELWDRHQVRRNALNLNRGDGTYANLACFAGVDASDWSWSVVFLDVDLDGYEDLLVVNKHAYDTQDLDAFEKEPQEMGRGNAFRVGHRLKDLPVLTTPNYLFRNRGNRTFEEVGARWGFNSTNVSHGIALADLDNDGDLDVVVSCLGQPPLVYRNDSTAPRVAVRLRGAAPNTRGIGAKIKVLGGAVPVQSQEMQCGGRYLSADDTIRAFAAGSTSNELTIEVAWRSGRRSLLRGARANRIYELDESAASPASSLPTPRAPPEPIFQDASDLLAHTHAENPFNELERQPLLWKGFARLGPGVAWSDLDGDGHEELAIGGSLGGRVAVFASDGRGGLKAWTSPALAAPLTGDLTALVSWTPAPGQRALLAGQSCNRDPAAAVSPLLRLDIRQGSSGPEVAFDRLPGLRHANSATGPIAVADLDGDGDLDVFVGGRLVPGRYPEPASSLMFRNEGGALAPDEASNALLKNIGLVSGAMFSDLNGDGFPELVLALEWGPVRILRNDHGKLAPWDPAVIDSSAARTGAGSGTGKAGPLKLSQFTGWWTGVAAGDFDGDGRLDLVAGNWGLNSSYHDPSSQEPLRMFYGDFDGNGTLDLLETEIETETGRLVPRRDLRFLSAGWPALRARFPTHHSFAAADVPAVLGPQMPAANQVQATTLASIVLLNRGDHFQAARLPDDAQCAPAFGLNVADFDGDGREDIFVSQNFFSNRPEEPRLDAGRGLVLRGDGTGRFAAVPGQESGVKVYGEQRGSAVGDFDEDGRVDLVVTQNGSSTRLFHNVRAKPGLRVRLQGPPANPEGIGAVMALEFEGQRGPAREVHGGSGYWSQDSVVQVLTTVAAPGQIRVRWPGGKTTTSPLPKEAREILVDEAGRLTVKR